MPPWLQRLPQWLFADDPAYAPSGRLIPRWIFLRSLGLIYFSAFYSLLRQVLGLIGPDGLQPAGAYLQAVKENLPGLPYWQAPTLFWFGSGSHALMAMCWVSLIASVSLTLNIWPRAMLLICFAGFLSFISVLQIFASYQSDGMLLGAGFVSLFFAPPGLRPGLGERRPASRASYFLLLWLWFRIYFESGIVKLASGDPQWRHLTAMDEYYQNGPLPSWVGWYAQHLPHWFHAGTAGFTLLAELILAWMMFLPRPFRIALFAILTPFQMGIILTSNYAFLNYLVLVLGFLLLDDKLLQRVLPLRPAPAPSDASVELPAPPPQAAGRFRLSTGLAIAWLVFSGFCLTWNFYDTTAELVRMVVPGAPLPTAPIVALEPSRIAESYGLFAVMTPARYEIEFQGSNDGTVWIPYPFRYKPQDPRQMPGIFAPYQPRFDWNLWFASLDNWRENRFVISTEEQLLNNSPSVLALFAGDPFKSMPPRMVRAVIWQYWFTDWAEKRQGFWWRRQLLGAYAPTIERQSDGKFAVVGAPEPEIERER